MIGGRTYCQTHFDRVAHESPASVRPIVVFAGAVVVFAGAVALLNGLVGPPLDGIPLLVLALLIAVIPAVIWLAAFYREDRLEPEPKRLVAAVFVLGAIAAEALGRPILRDFFHVQDWLFSSTVTALLGSILIIGFVQEFLKYAAIRYTVFNSAEFDERADGIIYGAAAGLGYSTMLNFRYVLENPGIDLGACAITVAVVSLAHATYSAVTGYFLGRAKFERMGPLWLPAGLSLAATLNGVTTFVAREVSLRGAFSYDAWLGLVAVALIAAGTFAVLIRSMRRANQQTVTSIGATGV
jgi:RsiW-degrading membrane proteinase PrsW (M82 family)